MTTEPRTAAQQGDWGVYRWPCIRCGRVVAVVATVHSVDHGYCETTPDTVVCSGCRAQEAVNAN